MPRSSSQPCQFPLRWAMLQTFAVPLWCHRFFNKNRRRVTADVTQRWWKQSAKPETLTTDARQTVWCICSQTVSDYASKLTDILALHILGLWMSHPQLFHSEVRNEKWRWMLFISLLGFWAWRIITTACHKGTTNHCIMGRSAKLQCFLKTANSVYLHLDKLCAFWQHKPIFEQRHDKSHCRTLTENSQLRMLQEEWNISFTRYAMLLMHFGLVYMRVCKHKKYNSVFYHFIFSLLFYIFTLLRARMTLIATFLHRPNITFFKMYCNISL